MQPISVLVFTENDSDRALIVSLLKNIEYIDLAGESSLEEEAWQKLNDQPVDVLLLGTTGSTAAYAFASKVQEQFAELKVIMLAERLQEDTLHQALMVGAKDVVLKPIEPEKLVRSIYRVAQSDSQLQVAEQKGPAPRAKSKKAGKIYTVFSTKGGVGKTFVSINFAASLAKNQEQRVVVVDLDLDYGTTALSLNLYPKFTVADVVDDIRNMDQDLIESYLIPHESGIKVLPANMQADLNEFINAQHVKLILETLKENFDYVIVDMPPRFIESIMPALALADCLLLIATPEISAIRNIKSLLITLGNLNFPQSKIKIILNKLDSHGEIKRKDVEATLHQAVDATIEYDYKKVLASLNKGVPLVNEYPRSPVSKAITKLAAMMVQLDGKRSLSSGV